MRRVLAVLVLLAVPAFAGEATREKLGEHLRASRWKQAIEMAEALLERTPEDGMLWFELGHAQHRAGEYEGAIRSNSKAAELSAIARPTALYNVACAQSLVGKLDEAERSLDRAFAEGFLQFELLRTDPDLAALRARGPLRHLPPPASYETHGTGNARTIRYRVLLPDGYDPEREYPAVLAFPPGPGTTDADWMISELFGTGVGENAIVLVVVAPPTDHGWFTHPAHHALEALLKKVRKEHRIAGDRYLFLGFGRGANPADTYSRMSGRYASGLVLAAGHALEDTDPSDVKRRWKDVPVRILLGSEDEAWNYGAADKVAALRAEGIDIELEHVNGDGRLLASLRGAALVDRVVTIAGR